jgi:hypothetical protein
MRTLRRGLACLTIAIATLVAATPACLSHEPGFAVNTTPGVTAGLAAAANPPPGLHYFNFAYGGHTRFSGSGAAAGIDGFKTKGVSEVPLLFWTTPWTMFGASWAVLLAAPWTGVDVESPAGVMVARIRGFHNPGLAPVMLSWNLGGGLFAKAGLFLWAPIGTIDAGPLNNGLGNIGAPYWTIEPHVAVSYLAHDLNLTANLIYGISTRNTYSGVTNGHTLNIDLTATKKFHGLEIGPVGYINTQVTGDSGCEAFYGPGVCARGAKAGIGGLIGYDFGAVHVRLAVTDTVHVRNTNDGWRVWSIVNFRLWAPPKP